MVVCALIRGRQYPHILARPLHLLPHIAAGVRTLVVAARVGVALDGLLPILAPPAGRASGSKVG
jgi:hypothetical protein